MPTDSQTFKDIMSRWASGITVVTCGTDQGVHGMTASSFTSVSLDPPLILVCVDRRNLTHKLMLEGGVFGVHILGTEMQEISDRCAGFLGEEGHWLRDVEYRTEATGAPILAGALAWMDCSVTQTHEGGDHTIFVAEIQAGGAADGEPLLWFERGYHRLAT
ncbi:MAG: flavin reductase family protein [Actinomycetota bacterium]